MAHQCCLYRAREKTAQTFLTLIVMREQSNNQGGILQERIGAMGNKKTHPLSLTSPFHHKERAKPCLRRTCYPTLQRGFMLTPTYGMGIGGQMAQGASFRAPACPGCPISAILSSPTSANPAASLGRRPAGCRGLPPAHISVHLSMRVGEERGHLRYREQLSLQKNPCPSAQCSFQRSSPMQLAG